LKFRAGSSGKVDFLNIIRGHIDTDAGLTDVIPIQGMASAPHLDFAGEIRAATRMPTFHAARIQDVATARHAIASGKLDMVGMTRAHIADPHIALKVMTGREHEIRPCVGMGYCIDRIYAGGDTLCAHNAATGREATMPHGIERGSGPRKKVVVVGAGPGGLEAARVAAARGHAVVLFEAANKPGGQLRLAAGLKRRREVLGIVDWRVAECLRDGVEMRLNSFAEAADVLREQPDVAIIATGGLPHTSFLDDGAELATTTWDILTGAVKPADSVLLFDDNGAHPGMSAAEFIADAGSRLEIATPERVLAPEVGGTNYPAYFQAFARHDVTISLNLRLQRIRREGNRLVATLYSDYDKSRRERCVDQVVVEHGTLPLDDLYFALKPGSRNLGEIDHDALIANGPQQVVRNSAGTYALYRIGDAVASRNVHAAVFDALRLMKDI